MVWSRGQTSFFCIWISTSHTTTLPFVIKIIVSPLNCLDTLTENQFTSDMVFPFRFSILLYWSICLSLCLDYCSFVASLDIRKYVYSNLFFFKIVVAIPGLLHFYMNFRISLSVSSKRGSSVFNFKLFWICRWIWKVLPS